MMNYKECIEKQAAINKDVTFNPVQQKALNNPSSNIILAHPVGSGKTLAGIAKFEKLKAEGKANKALIITPSSLRTNYSDNGIKKFTDSSANIIGNKQEISKKTGFNPDPNSDYNIVSYDIFRKNPNEILKQVGADTIITDEVHKLKNPNTKTLQSFYDSKDNYKNFIGLTGSVASNKVSDIYNLVDLASKGTHNLGKSRQEFERTYLVRSNSPKYKGVDPERIPVVGFKNKNQLKSELKKYIDYADIDDIRESANIPDKNLRVKKVPISRQQAKIYKRLIDNDPELRKIITKKRLETMKDDEISRAFNNMIESRKLMNSVGSVIPGISLERSAKITPKTRKLLDDMEKHLKKTPDGQVILMSNLINGGVDVMEADLKRRGIDYGKFIGKGNKGVTEETRQKDVVDYNNRKKRVMLISSAGGEGISLGDTTAEYVLDGFYNPEVMKQMEARGIRSNGLSHRPDKEREVDVTRYMSTMPRTFGIFKSKYKTPDEIVYSIAENKEKQNQLLFDLLKENDKKKLFSFK